MRLAGAASCLQTSNTRPSSGPSTNPGCRGQKGGERDTLCLRLRPEWPGLVCLRRLWHRECQLNSYSTLKRQVCARRRADWRRPAPKGWPRARAPISSDQLGSGANSNLPAAKTKPPLTQRRLSVSPPEPLRGGGLKADLMSPSWRAGLGWSWSCAEGPSSVG